MAIELYLTCQGATPHHEFQKTFEDPIDWSAVNAAMKLTRCDEHPEYRDWNGCDWD